MSKDKRKIQKEDIIPLDVYIKNRKELRKNIVNFKKKKKDCIRSICNFLL